MNPTHCPRPVARFSALAAILMFAAGAAGLHAANKTWNNAGTDFNTTTNWTNGTPTSADNALFGTVASN
jgi:hypothetical protein